MKRAVFLFLLIAACLTARATDVMFFVDAEDYTCDYSSDVLRDFAKLMNGEGVQAQFNMVGYLARHLRQQGRDDVFKALKFHQIGSHTLYCAKHPTVAESTDVPDAAQAGRLALAEESLALGLIKSSFGIPSVALHAPAGPYSYAALYAAADMGMTFCAGEGLAALAPANGGTFWYCGLWQLPILDRRIFSLESLLPPAPEPDYSAVLDKLAARQYVGLRLETSFIACRSRWTTVNFNPKKPVPFGEWKPNVKRPAADVTAFYARVRKLVRALKADPRFRLVSIHDYQDALPVRRAITVRDVPIIRGALEETFGPVAELNLSLSDVYQACVDFLRGERLFKPDQVRGFLEEPEGITAETKLSAADLRSAATKLVDVDYIPARIAVGKAMVGPADFVRAALEVLETNAESVTVKPGEQLGLGGAAWPIRKGKDKFLSDRLRLQSWTLRPAN